MFVEAELPMLGFEHGCSGAGDKKDCRGTGVTV